MLRSQNSIRFRESWVAKDTITAPIGVTLATYLSLYSIVGFGDISLPNPAFPGTDMTRKSLYIVCNRRTEQVKDLYFTSDYLILGGNVLL